MNTNPLQKAVKAAMFTGAALAVALPAAYAADADDSVEEITVTGSRIKRDGFDSVSPVSVTSAEEISVSGYTRVEDLLNTLPQIESSNTAFQSNGASGTASVDLRGLGTNRTLVLVNGRRLQPGNFQTQAADINQIPAALIERVEVLTGGASATYGADAVAGVVNFIMKNDFEGVEVTVGASGYQHNNDNKYIQGLMDARNFEYPTGSSGIDGEGYSIDVTVGSEFGDGKGHAVAYAVKRDNEELRQEARDYSSCALNSAGTSCGGSGNAIVPNFFIGDIAFGQVDANGDPVGNDGVQDNYTFWTLDPAGDGFIPSVGNTYNFAPVNHFQRPDTRYSLGAFANYEVNDQFKPYLEVSYTNDRTKAQIAESGTFFAEQYNLDINSPLLSDTQRAQLLAAFPAINNPASPYDGQFSVYIGKRNVEGGPRTNILESNATRFVVGSEGSLTENWDYNASYQYGQTTSGSTYINDFFAPRIATAVDSDACAATSGCIPYEVFTLNGVTAESAGALTGTGILNGNTEERIFNAYVTGDTGYTLPSADTSIAMVVGIETREEIFERTSDEVFERGLLLGQGGPTASLTGRYSVDEFFTEANIPVITGNQELIAELAYRYSDYSTSGGESTYKVGLEYAPTDKVRLRGGYNRAVRSANVGELFSAQTLGLWNGTDPCGGNGTTVTPSLTQAECVATGLDAANYNTVGLLSPASQYNGVFGGNPDLTPEIADTITLGVVLDPIDDLRISLDYWDIELEDVIGTAGSELTVEQCGKTGLAIWCDNVIRGAGGSLWRGTAGFVRSTLVNLGNTHFEGIDLAASYNIDALGGTLTNKFQGTYMLTKEFETLPGAEGGIFECVGDISTQCFAQPEWRSILSTTYDRGGDWTVNARWRHMGKVHNYDGVDTLAEEIGDQNYLDLSGTYDVNENIGLLFGINNILDKEPPLVGGTLSSNANAPGGYDPLGRYIYGSVTFSY